jgi:AraC-like DNA-binding protein
VSAVTPPVREDLLVGLRRARDHVDRHYADPLDLDALAAVAGLSKYHFLRCFARTYGLTPGASSPSAGWSARRTCYARPT